MNYCGPISISITLNAIASQKPHHPSPKITSPTQTISVSVNYPTVTSPPPVSTSRLHHILRSAFCKYGYACTEWMVFDFEKETNLRGEKFLAHFLFDVLPLKIIFRPFDRGRKKIMEEAPSHSLLKTDSELNAQLMPRGSDPTSLNSIYMNPADVFSDVVGSPYYIAPEILCTHYSPEADVWSAGVILYILVSGVPPFWAETKKEIFEEVLHGDLNFSSDPWPNISQSAEDLVRKMLVRDPRKRITAHEILCHPWIQVDGVAPDKPLDSAVLSRLKQFSAMNKLKKMALRVIAQHLSEEEIAGLKEMFKVIDADNSGQITFEELKHGLERFGANLNESEIHDLMHAADVDNSGTIDYDEFIAATLHLNKIERDHLFAAFSYFDKDSSGYITQDELQQACEEFGIEDSHLEEMIREVDQDNDGRIDYDEFVAMMEKGNTNLGKKDLHSGFSMGFREALTVC